jgi:CheY-like chemotaxis protein
VSGAPHRVLVVEDNPGDARLIELALRSEAAGAFSVCAFGRLADALAAARAERFDVALIDLHLPDAEGPEGVRSLRTTSAEGAIVAMSGSDEPAPIRAALAAGADGFLRKERYARGAVGASLRAAVAGHRASAAITAGGRWGGPLDPAPEAFVGLRGPVLEYANPAARALVPAPEHEAASLWAAVRSDWPEASFVSLGEVRLDAGTGPSGPIRWTAWRPQGTEDRALLWLRRLAPQGSPAGSAPGRPVLDSATWADLREQAGDDRAFLPQLVRVFREYATQLVREVEDAHQRGDVPALGRLAHTLKSSAAQVGALDLAAAAARVEASSGAGDRVAALAGVPDVVREFDRAFAALAGGPPAA